MKYTWLFFFVAVSVLVSSHSSNAVEWVVYDGTVPEHAVTTYSEDTASLKRQMPICRYGTSVGFLGGKGVCNTVGQDLKRERYKKDFYVLVSSAAEWKLFSSDLLVNSGLTTNSETTPICRYRRTVGWLDIDQGVCHTVGMGKKVKQRTSDFYVLIDPDDIKIVKKSPCQNSGTFNSTSGICACYPGYDGDNCENEAACNQSNKQKSLYVNYDFDPPLNQSNAFDVSAEITWTDINGIDAYNKNGIYEAYTIKMGQDGPGGYFGAQIKGKKKRHEDMLLFSIWDTKDGKSMVWPMHKNCNRNCNDCGAAHSGGMGVKCNLDMDMAQGDRYTMRIHRTAEKGTYTADDATYTGPVWQVTAVNEDSDEEIIVGKILFQDLDADQGLSNFNGFHEHIGCTRCASFYSKVGRKDPVVHAPATTALVDVSGKHTCADCSCDMYNITREGDSIFFETGPGTEPDFSMGESIEFSVD